MTSPEFETTLRSVLDTPMTARQRAALDARLEERLADATSHGIRVRRRSILLAAAVLLLVVPAVFPVSALIRTTEAPLGLESSSAFQAEIDAAEKLVPLPAGATWPPYLVAQDGANYSAGGGRSWVEMVAFCSWSRSWLDATRTGASEQAQVARTTILSVSTWELYGGQFSTDSSRNAIGRVIAAVRAGDASTVAGFVQLNCAG